MSVSGFGARVQAVFGVLEQPGSPVTWNLEKNVIFKGGEEEQVEAGSELESDQEEEEEFQQRKLMFVGSAVTDNSTQIVIPDMQVPTKQFTNAMDNELEEDAYDRIATQSYGRHSNSPSDENPLLNPPPLIDQPNESTRIKRSRLDQAFHTFLANKIKAPETTHIMEIDQQEIPISEKQQQSVRANGVKRVRFNVPEQVEIELNQDSNNQIPGSSNQVVVKNSVKQTCYELDESLIVGGGLNQLNNQQEQNFEDQFLNNSNRYSLLNSNDFESGGEIKDTGIVFNESMEAVKLQINILNKQCNMDVDVSVEDKSGSVVLTKEDEEEQEIGGVNFSGQEKKLRKQRNYRKAV
eukprot:TRINITY_DN3761_c0_g1_i2.p1 TRINITY_DN3761_c0_g1~~TRINITY_DN3761_c0_g1_i2.p1  ORF type:complete len:351 (-),score=61.94 TRINITY_DN3761_c0_g1_i2:1153-2205(-)